MIISLSLWHPSVPQFCPVPLVSAAPSIPGLTGLFELGVGARRQVPCVCAMRHMRSSGHRRCEALAGAPLDNAPKEYPPKIQQLVQDIASLTLLEISDLNELLKVS